VKERVEGVNLIIYLIHHKKFCKCYNVPPPSKTIIIKEFLKRKKWERGIYSS
jgi:hypothetical protein